jgi:TolB protein
MGGKWSKAVLAAALTVAGVSGVVPIIGGATVQAAQHLQAVQTDLIVDGLAYPTGTITVNGTRQYAVRDLIHSIGGQLTVNGSELSVVLDTASSTVNTITFKPGEAAYTVNGEAKTFQTAPTYVAGRIYVELEGFVEGLGGSLLENDGANGANGATAVRSFSLLTGEFEYARWVTGSQIAAVRESDKATYLIDAATGRSSFLTGLAEVAEMVVSPDGKYGVCLNEQAQLTLIQLDNGSKQVISKDTSVKTDPVWSVDGKTIYFIQGDNQEKIAKVNVVSGEITKLVEDKVSFKSDLRVSADEKKLLYFVNATGTAKNDADSTEDSLSIDYSTAGTKLVSFDLTVKDAKAVDLAVGADNKLTPQWLADGRAAYISIDLDKDEVVGVLTAVGDGNKVSVLLPEISASTTWVSPAGELYVLGTAKNGQSVLTRVKADGSATQVATTELEASELSVSPSGDKAAIIADGKIAIISAAGAVFITE